MWKPTDLQIRCLREFYEHYQANPLQVGSKVQIDWEEKYTAQEDFLLNKLDIPKQVVKDVDQQGTAYCTVKEAGNLTNEYQERFNWDYWWPIYYDSCKDNYFSNGMTPEEYKYQRDSIAAEEKERKRIELEKNRLEPGNFQYQLNDVGEKIPLFPILTEIGVKNYEPYNPPADIDSGEGLTLDVHRLKAYLVQLKPGDMFRFGSILDGNKSYAKYVGTHQENGKRCYIFQNEEFFGTFYENEVMLDLYWRHPAFIVRECDVKDFDRNRYYEDLIEFDKGTFPYNANKQ